MITPVLGSTGASVALARRRLSAWDCRSPSAGPWDRNDIAAVMKFQRKRGLAVDGIIGIRTWAHLLQPVPIAPPKPPPPKPKPPIVVPPKPPVVPPKPPVVVPPKPPVKPPPFVPAQGVDLSNNDGASVDMAKIKKAGKTFVYLKATEGTGYQDAYYAIYRTSARKQALFVGAYHFAHTGDPKTGTQQAAFFLATARPKSGDLIPAIDWEPKGGDDPHQVPTLEAIASEIHNQLHVWPALYGFPSMLIADHIPATSVLRNCPLWYSDIGGDPKARSFHPIPSPWKSVTIRQYDTNGKCPGVPGAADLDSMWVPIKELLIP